LNFAVAAGRELALVVAVGAAVASFSELLGAVPANRALARVAAAVVVDPVAVVALFGLSRGAQLNESVATDGVDAFVRTGVAIDVVAVVALLAVVYDFVPAQVGGAARVRNFLVITAGDQIHRQ
jgi:hypothetical protein